MTNNHDTFQLHENHVEVTHKQMWNNQVCGVTSSAISYDTFFNLLETIQGQEITVVNPVDLYIELAQTMSLTTIEMPSHLLRLEYVQGRGVYITQVYGGANEPHIFSEINADKSRIAVRFFVNRGLVIELNSIQVFRFEGLTVPTANLSEMTPLPVLAETFRQLLGTDTTVRNLSGADMSKLVKKIPSRGRVSLNVRRAINEAKETNTVINWEGLE